MMAKGRGSLVVVNVTVAAKENERINGRWQIVMGKGDPWNKMNEREEASVCLHIFALFNKIKNKGGTGRGEMHYLRRGMPDLVPVGLV